MVGGPAGDGPAVSLLGEFGDQLVEWGFELEWVLGERETGFAAAAI